jgi:HK97 family phage major capsid protein
MDFNLDEMSVDQLNELLAAVQAKLAQMEAPEGEAREGEETEAPAEVPAEIAEIVDSLTDNLDELEQLVEDIEGRKAAISAKTEKRAKLIQRLANNNSQSVIRTFGKPDKEEKRMFTVDSVEYRNAFLKNLQGKDLTAEERAAVTATAAIPTETANKIWGKMELYPILNAIDVMHIPGNVILPVEGTINAAAVVAMGTAATDGADTLTPVSLGAYKLIKTVEITADVAAMAIPAFENWLVDRLANKLFRLVAALVAAGTGTNEPAGLATITATGTYTKAAITYADLLTIIGSLPAEYDPNACFVMSRATFYGNVLNVTTTQKQPVVVADPQAPAKYNIFGFPVIIEDGVGTDIIFGDLKEGYVWNFGKDIEVESDASVAFRTGSVVYRGMALGDGKPTGVGLVRYTKASA